MSNENTIETVRLALSLHEMQARLSGANIANASKPHAVELRADFAKAEAALREAANATSEADAAHWLETASREFASTKPEAGQQPIKLDEQISLLASASVEYQALTEALNRKFGLMRIAIAGRI
jgi:flagellar basal body rod protein FlgB